MSLSKCHKCKQKISISLSSLYHGLATEDIKYEVITDEYVTKLKLHLITFAQDDDIISFHIQPGGNKI